MNYYEHHIGDFDTATAHLSLVEDAIYTRMLRLYYRQEGPLPTDPLAIARLIRARDEMETVKSVLHEFFRLSDDGWHNQRADEDIEKFKAKQNKARASADARWSNVKPGCERNANASETHDERNALQSPVPSPQLKANDPSDHLPAAACPHTEILALYHELLPANPRIKVWDTARSSTLRARWREDAKRQSLDYWRRFFTHVAASPFLTGKVPDRNGRPFLPGLDWLLKAANFAKVIEGRYHDAR